MSPTAPNGSEPQPTIEIFVASTGGAAADGETLKKIDKATLQVVQTHITNIVTGFVLPAPPPKSEGMHVDSVELEIGFELEAGVGHVWRLLLVDGKGTASIKAKVAWKRA
jgi:hypothetical protein